MGDVERIGARQYARGAGGDGVAERRLRFRGHRGQRRRRPDQRRVDHRAAEILQARIDVGARAVAEARFAGQLAGEGERRAGDRLPAVRIAVVAVVIDRGIVAAGVDAEFDEGRDRLAQPVGDAAAQAPIVEIVAGEVGRSRRSRRWCGPMSHAAPGSGRRTSARRRASRRRSRPADARSSPFPSRGRARSSVCSLTLKRPSASNDRSRLAS